jgi:hypothetical protein
MEGCEVDLSLSLSLQKYLPSQISVSSSLLSSPKPSCFFSSSSPIHHTLSLFFPFFPFSFSNLLFRLSEIRFIGNPQLSLLARTSSSIADCRSTIHWLVWPPSSSVYPMRPCCTHDVFSTTIQLPFNISNSLVS